MTLKFSFVPLALAASLSLPGVAQAEKICETTYSNGQRCTFCYYTTQPASGSTTCIAWQAPGQGSNNNDHKPGFGVVNRLSKLSR